MKPIKIEGLKELQVMLKDLAPKEANNVARAALYNIATEGAKEVKSNAPVATGNMKNSVKAVRLKSRGRSGTEVRAGILIPDKVAQSPSAPNGLLTWKQVEFGSQNHPAEKFVEPVREKIRTNFSSNIKEMVAKKLAKFMARKLRKVK